MSTFQMGGVLSMAAKWVDGSATAADAVQVQLPLSGGSGAGQADSYWRMSISIAAGATHNIDLTALAASYFGGSVSLYLYSVKVLMLRNLSLKTPLAVNSAATNAWTAFRPGTIGPDSVVMFREGAGNGRLVTNTSKVISVVNSDTTTSLAGTATGTTITGLSSTTGLYVGMLLGGTHPSGTTISTIASSTSVTTSAAVTTNGAATFGFTPPPAVLDVLVVGVLD